MENILNAGENLILSYHVNTRGNFYWPSIDTRLMPEEMKIIDLVKRQKLVQIIYEAWDYKTGEPDAIKHIWVKRLKNGAVEVSDGIECVWEPMTATA